MSQQTAACNSSASATPRLADAGAVTSIGPRGDSYENASAEATIGLDKAELIHRRGPWRTIDDVEPATPSGSTGSTTGASTAPADTCPNRVEKLYYLQLHKDTLGAEVIEIHRTQGRSEPLPNRGRFTFVKL